MFNGFKTGFKNHINNFKIQRTNTYNNSFNYLSKKGMKLSQLHFYTAAGQNTPSGIKVCIFGATASIGSQMAAFFTPKGCPTVMVHRNALDVVAPTGDDVLFNRSNPYYSYFPSYMQYDLQNDDLGNMRSWTDVGMRYFQLTNDLTNEYDIETAIKDCDVVINLVGNKSVIRHDENYEEPNIWIPRAIAKVCAKKNNNVKRLVHFSACGAGPDAPSRRLRTKWQGEQEVLKYYPESTIIRPTSMISNSIKHNFIGHYLHCWNNNNGTIYMLGDGDCLRQPVLDLDVCLAVHNALQIDESKGQIYELGGPHQYKMKELMEFLSNVLNHRPKYVKFTYDDFMKLYLAPNSHWEKAIHWLIARPDYIAEQASDILVHKRDGVKTFEDLFIHPLSMQHALHDLGQWCQDRLSVLNQGNLDHDENDANDDAN